MLECHKVLKGFEKSKLLVILSATYQTTNQLEEIAAVAKVDTAVAFDKLDQSKKRHLQMAMDLGIDKDCHDELSSLYEEQKETLLRIQKDGSNFNKWMDELYSLGEKVSTLLFSKYLNKKETRKSCLVDAREFIITDSEFSRGNPDLDLIEQTIQKNLVGIFEDHDIVVTQGFVGRSRNQETVTLGREGSDFSAALFAYGLNAQEVHIMTDVPGIAWCDPRLCEEVPFFEKISYDLASEMAMKGAKVLFPRTMEPAKLKNIQIRVAKTSHPEIEGTWVCSKKDSQDPDFVVSIEDVEDKFQLNIIGNAVLEKEYFNNPFDLEDLKSNLKRLLELYKKS